MHDIVHFFNAESQLQPNEEGIEIIPVDNGQSVIYHCIGPSTSAGKTVSDSEQPEMHHYFELEALPCMHTHHAYQNTDNINQLSLGRKKDEPGTATKSDKAIPVYEEITLCSQKFQVGLAMILSLIIFYSIELSLSITGCQ
jgi:hypothetical protein